MKLTNYMLALYVNTRSPLKVLKTNRCTDIINFRTNIVT